MNFQTLKKVETADTYLDMAFRRAKDKAKLSTQKKFKENIKKSQYIEEQRINAVCSSINKKLKNILISFPSLDSLTDFYKELISCMIDYPMLKKSLGAINWAARKIDKFTAYYALKVKRCQHHRNISQYRREYYGRVSSVMKQIRKELVYLEEARKIMRNFPSVKTSIFTAAICGFPNIGKTTLLSKLTAADPKISDYSFTTKGINIGYIIDKDTNKRLVQLLDTPGTLNRFEKMNQIEQQAYIAIKHAAQMLIYIFDLTGTYPIKDQIKLLKRLKKEKKEIVLYLSKSDITAPDEISAFLERYGCITDAEKLGELLKKKASSMEEP